MTDHRQCGRCGRSDVIAGTALDSAHDCQHGNRCEAIPGPLVFYCQRCVTDRVADIRAAAERSLPGAAAAMLRASGGIQQ